MHSQAVAVINGKGGTHKTTISTNLAGVLAVAGHRVALVDCDPQGNVLDDLGLVDSAIDDQGAGLAAALTGRGPLILSPTGRDRLDVVVSGEVLKQVEVEPTDLDDALAGAVADHDLVVIDCPPGYPQLQRAALTAARWVLIPTRADDASIRGMRAVARLFAEVRADTNPDLELLGVVLAGIGSQSRRVLRDTRDKVAELFGREDAMMLSTIRHAEVPSLDARNLGRLAHELDRDTYASLAAGSLPAATGPRRYPSSAPGVAGDHQRLAAEVAQRLAARAAAAAESSAES